MIPCFFPQIDSTITRFFHLDRSPQNKITVKCNKTHDMKTNWINMNMNMNMNDEHKYEHKYE
jgi:hypothetical protein